MKSIISTCLGLISLVFLAYSLLLKLIFDGLNQSSELEKTSKEVYFLLFFEVIVVLSIVLLGLKLAKTIIELIRFEKK